MTRLLLIRHAPVDAGPSPGRLCGTFDLPLNDTGRRQLDALCERWAGRDAPDGLYSSTLQRAREVADALGHLWHLVPRYDDALSEIDCGAFEGVPLVHIQREHADLWARNLAQQDDEFAWPGGESYREFRGRVLGGLSRIAARHRGGTVVIVTHAGVIAQVMGALRGRPAAVWEPDRPEPLSETEILWVNGSPGSVVRFNAHR